MLLIMTMMVAIASTQKGKLAFGTTWNNVSGLTTVETNDFVTIFHPTPSAASGRIAVGTEAVVMTIAELGHL